MQELGAIFLYGGGGGRWSGELGQRKRTPSGIKKPSSDCRMERVHWNSGGESDRRTQLLPGLEYGQSAPRRSGSRTSQHPDPCPGRLPHRLLAHLSTPAAGHTGSGPGARGHLLRAAAPLALSSSGPRPRSPSVPPALASSRQPRQPRDKVHMDRGLCGLPAAEERPPPRSSSLVPRPKITDEEVREARVAVFHGCCLIPFP